MRWASFTDWKCDTVLGVQDVLLQEARRGDMINTGAVCSYIGPHYRNIIKYILQILVSENYGHDGTWMIAYSRDVKITQNFRNQLIS